MVTNLAETVPRRRNVGTLGPDGGPDDLLLYTFSDAPASNAPVAAILWGFGVAEVKTARRLAKAGFPCLQVRFKGKPENGPAPELDKSNFGIEACRLAMDKLMAELGITSFVFMGNCAFANLCINAAIADPRVVGLILTNAHIPNQSVAGKMLWHKLSKPSTWTRLVRGDINLGGAARFLRFVAGSWGKRAARASKQVASPPTRLRRSDVVLPPRLDEEFRKLSARQVKMLVTGASGDSIFRRFAIVYGKSLRKLGREGNITFEELDTSFHLFSRDDDASVLLAGTVTRWMQSTDFPCTQ